MNSSADPRRGLPAVDELLKHPALQGAEIARPVLVSTMRRVLDEWRQKLADGSASQCPETLSEKIVEKVLARAEQSEKSRLQPVINGTGILLHTNLGRAPFGPRIVERAMSIVQGYANVEWMIPSGQRGGRGGYVQHLFQVLTGAEAALLVNNCAAATWLALQALAAGRRVVVSRGQLVEIGGSYRLPDIMNSAGVRLQEVGTTNRTHAADYSRAIDAETAAILRVHQSNFRIEGFNASVPIEELVRIAHDRGLLCLDDLGSGCLVDVRRFGLSEPLVQDSLKAGADLVLFSGDKLLGGPQSGILLGKQALIDQVRQNPLTRAFRVDKLTTAFLEATLECYLNDQAFEQIPVLRMIAMAEAELEQRCRNLCEQLPERVRSIIQCERCESQIGGGSIAGQALPSWALTVQGSANRMEAQLRNGSPAVATRIHQGRVFIDLRTVFPEEEAALRQRLAQLEA